MADAAMELLGDVAVVADVLGCGAVSSAIAIISKCVETYQNFYAFKEEAISFRNVLLVVRDVLLDVEEQLKHGGLRASTRSLTQPLDLITGAVEKGRSVLEKCAQKKTLQVVAFSKTYLTKLTSAKRDIIDALSLISACGVSVQGQLKTDLDNSIAQLDQSIRTQSHEVAREVSGLIQPGMDALPDQIVEKLVQLGLVTGRIDCNEQLREIQEAKDAFRREKAFADEDILERILALSVQDRGPQTVHVDVAADADTIEKRLYCPILQDVVQDPVLLIAGDDTKFMYDRQALIRALARRPYTEPTTRLEYDEPLRFVDSVEHRQLLQQHYGEQAYVPYDVEEANKEPSLTTSPLSSNTSSPTDSRPTTNLLTGSPSRVFRAFLALFCLLAIGVVVGGVVVARNKRNRDSAVPAPMAAPTSTGEPMYSLDVAMAFTPTAKPTAAPTSMDQPRFRASLDAAMAIAPQLRAFSPNAYESALGWMASGTAKNHSFHRQLDDPLLEQRFVLAWFWYHTTNNGQEPWLSCNPPNASSLFNDEEENNDMCEIIEFQDTKIASRWLLGTDECTWAGITCDSFGQVLMIGLDGKNLQGEFPIFLSHLPKLSSLYLVNNKLIGELPIDFSSFSKLELFSVRNNSLSGTIPDSIYSIPNLSHLYLSSNLFSGQLSSHAIANASALVVLDLFKNAFTGNLPDGIGHLLSLQILSLQENPGFAGSTIPPSFGNLSQLKHLWMGNIGLVGRIPQEFSKLQFLETLQLQDNQLTGPLLSIQSPALITFIASNNLLNGTIPDALYNLTNLQTLYFWKNRLTGPLKPAIGNLKSLVDLSIADNQLTGKIPLELSYMTSLKTIGLYYNQFSGSVPSAICNMQAPDLVADCLPPLLSSGGDEDYNKCTCCSVCCDRVNHTRACV
jgi:Leucine-rich repeat (LRR) protein